MTKEKKGKVRNFTFVESADTRLLELVDKTGKSMTTVLEDLLLGKREFPREIEAFIAQEMELRNISRETVIEVALMAEYYRVNSTSPVRAAEARLRRGKQTEPRSNALKAPHAPKSA